MNKDIPPAYNDFTPTPVVAGPGSGPSYGQPQYDPSYNAPPRYVPMVVSQFLMAFFLPAGSTSSHLSPLILPLPLFSPCQIVVVQSTLANHQVYMGN